MGRKKEEGLTIKLYIPPRPGAIKIDGIDGFSVVLEAPETEKRKVNALIGLRGMQLEVTFRAIKKKDE